MKRKGIIVSKISSWLFIIFLFYSCSVVRTPFFKTAYYQKTVSRLDSIKSDLSCVYDSLYAGFARVSITPYLNSIVENSEEGRLNNVPLAGFGQRRV